MSNSQTTAIAPTVVISFVVALLIGGHQHPSDYFDAVSYSISFLGIVLLLWERWLWSWKYFNPLLTTRPDLRGTWRGYIVSDWIDPETKQTRGRIESYLVIRQRFSSIDVRLHTAESGSTTLSAHIIEDGEGLHSVAVLYENTRGFISGREVLLVMAGCCCMSGAIQSINSTENIGRREKRRVKFGLKNERKNYAQILSIARDSRTQN